MPRTFAPHAAAVALRAGADLIEQRGWWHADPTPCDDGQRVCAVLAVDAAVGDVTTTFDACVLLARHLGLTYGPRSPSGAVTDVDAVIRWNDAQSDPHVVVAAMRDAAATVSQVA